MKENVLVTGGGGFLGKAIVKKLLIKGFCVKSFSRNHYSELDKLGVKQIQGDLQNFNQIDDAFKDCDLVFHVAAKAGIWGRRDDFFGVNVIGTENVINACKNNKISRLIYTSSPSVVFDGTDMEGVDEQVPYPAKFEGYYPETKAIAEKLVVKETCEDLKTVILRPHLIWGPEDNHIVPGIIQRAKKIKKIGRLDDLVDTIYIDNAADAHILAAEKLKSDASISGNIYFVSQDKPVSKWYIADKFLEAAGLPPIKGRVSARTAYIAGAVFEFIYSVFNIIKDPPITKFAAKEAAGSHWFDISKAKKELGYVPKVSIEQGLKQLKQWFEKENAEI
ncbi:MAG: NAD-dependent epimerase/dehydratase family protein [Desulfobacteraceae bacterium]|nr:NAD-dependent epimerase/dehydratase family protein [Desulfobacteraceae bacterium]